MICLLFVLHHEQYRLEEDKHNAATGNMGAIFGEKTFDEEDLIKLYTKKQFFLPS